MKRWILSTLSAFLALGIAGAQTILITEIQYDDSGDDDYEYVELYNPNSFPVDISGWVLQSGDQLTGDNNRDFIFPAGTVIPAGGYLVVGDPNIPNVNIQVDQDIISYWENDNEWTALRDTNNVVVDAVAYEVNKAPNLSTWVPSNIIPQLGRGIWGNYLFQDGTLATTDATRQSISRYFVSQTVAIDTNVNGRDFGLLTGTPGASNYLAPPPFPYVENFDSFNVGDVFNPNGVGSNASFRYARVIDPTLSDTPGGNNPSNPNPNAIATSPQGGNALIAWDWAGGGNQVAGNFVFQGNAGYEMWVYVNPTLAPTNQNESWAIGLLGHAESVYNTPYIGTSANACGITGIAWVFFKDSTGAFLRLVDAKDGGDSRLSSSYWTTFGTVDLSQFSAGWYRLKLKIKNGQVTGSFGSITFTGSTDANLVGTFYIGYREALTPNDLTRPVTIDDLKLYVPGAIEGDVNGDGCVDDADLLAVLFAFGGSGGAEDINSDGIVDDADLLVVLFNFGSGC